MCSVSDCVVVSGGSALIWRIWVLMMAESGSQGITKIFARSIRFLLLNHPVLTTNNYPDHLINNIFKKIIYKFYIHPTQLPKNTSTSPYVTIPYVCLEKFVTLGLVKISLLTLKVTICSISQILKQKHLMKTQSKVVYQILWNGCEEIYIFVYRSNWKTKNRINYGVWCPVRPIFQIATFTPRVCKTNFTAKASHSRW